MFLCNDPWVGGGLHQNDVIVYQPDLPRREAVRLDQRDLPRARPRRRRPRVVLPAPPRTCSPSRCRPRRSRSCATVELQRDVADLWVRRSRVPHAGRARPAGQDRRQQRRRASACSPSSSSTAPTRVKAVMKRMMADAEQRLRAKLASLPDGSWSATGYQDQSHEGDRGLHKITVTTTKTGDHLTFDFTGTDPQAGVINCTYAGMRGGVMLALLPILAGDIPWSAGGLMRCFDLIAEEGTINNATFPAAVEPRPRSARPGSPATSSPNAFARCSTRPEARPARPGHLLRHLGHRGASPASTSAASTRSVPRHHHGPDGRRVRRPAARRRHRHRRCCSASRWAACPTSR